ncbi:hypothetical protein OAK66_02915 [Candidatus Nitrosopelagicus sp.]|nr:hypothetical protein [Candidatus Nitrosopelagicus sp.]
MRKISGTFILLLGIMPLFALSAFGGGGFGSAISFEVLKSDSGFIIQQLDETGNTVFLQHVLTNDSGTPVNVSVSSFQSVEFQKVDETCKPITLFTNHILVIPYSPVQISDLGRYVMLPALVEFEHPETFEPIEIYFEKYNLLLDDGVNAGFTNAVDFSCDDVYAEMNPRYEHAFDDNLGMQDSGSSSSQAGGQGNQQQGGGQGNQQQGGEQENNSQNGPQSGTNLTPQEQELLQQAEELLSEYEMAAELQNAPVNPTERPYLVEQNTEQFRDEIRERMQIQEQLMQQLQQNSDFQNFDEQLSNEGLTQQPPSLSMSDDETLLSVPYENDDMSAAISAEFQNGQITNVLLERPSDEIESNLLWIIPLIIGVIAVAVFISMKLPKKKSIIQTPMIVKNDNYTISYVDLTREMLTEAQQMYDEDLFKDAHEKLSQSIRFYYSNRFSTGTEITNMDALQLLRKENIPEFDSILDYLSMCEMIEFAKNPTERKRFFSAIERFSQIIE